MASSQAAEGMPDSSADTNPRCGRNLAAATDETKLRLQQWVRELMAVSDGQWARFMYKQQSGRRGLPPEEWTTHLERLLSSAQTSALTAWTTLWDEGESSLRCDVLEALEDFGVSVSVETPGMLDKVFLHFGAYDPGRRVVDLSEYALSQVERCIVESGLSGLLDPLSVRKLVLWHEYYHVWMRRRDQQNATDKRQGWKNWISRLMTPNAGTAVSGQLAEEIGAILFSKMACGLDYNPQVLQWLLVYTEQPDRALKMLKDILEESVIT